MKEKRCPICGNIITFYPAISRKDNKTEICSDCGVLEALEQFNKNSNFETYSIEKLNEAKEMLINNENLVLDTYNKNTKFEGVASFFRNGENKIKVFEGSSDGSDDCEVTYEEFIKNYKCKLREEY